MESATGEQGRITVEWEYKLEQHQEAIREIKSGSYSEQVSHKLSRDTTNVVDILDEQCRNYKFT